MTKIKIDVNGQLYISKFGKWESQYCCYKSDESCGVHCPHFREPCGNHLDICNGTTIYFNECKIEDN